MHATPSLGEWRRAAVWLLPVGALFLVAQGARARPLALPQIWTVTLALSVLAVASSAWLIAVRTSRVERILLGLGFTIAVVILFLAVRRPRNTSGPVSRGSTPVRRAWQPSPRRSPRAPAGG